MLLVPSYTATALSVPVAIVPATFASTYVVIYVLVAFSVGTFVSEFAANVPSVDINVLLVFIPLDAS